MAKKGQLDFGSLELDDNLDFGFGDFEDSKPQASSKREVVMDTVKAVGTGMKDSILEPGNIRRAMKSSLPEGLGKAFDIADEAAGSAATLYDQAVRELKPGLSTLTKKIDNLVPEQSTRLKKVTSKLHDMFKVESGSSYNSQNVEDQGVETMLKGMFATQMEQQNLEREREETHDKLRDRIEANRHTGEMRLFSRMDYNLQRLGEYKTTTEMAYQKKSLELQFRSYFTLSEMLRQSKEVATTTKTTLEGILKNTALPEFVKIRESERFKQIAKDKLWTGLHNRMFGEGSRIRAGLDKLQEKGKEVLSGFKQGIEGGMMLTDSMEQIQETNAMMEEMGGKKKTVFENFGQMGGSFLGEFGLSKAADYIRKKLNESEKVQLADQKASRWLSNPDELINSYQDLDFVKNADLEGGIKGKVATLFGDFLQMFRSENGTVGGSTGNGTENLIEANYSDERSRRAQVDVIPGYLARILREIRVFRTKDESQGLTVFDFNTGKFKSQTQLSQDIKDSISKKFQSSSLGIAKNVVASQFLQEQEIPSEDKGKLDKILKVIMAQKDVTFDEKGIKESKEYKKLKKEDQEILQKYHFEGKVGPNSESSKLADILTKLTKERGITLDEDGITSTKTYGSLGEKEKEILRKHVFSKISGDDLESERYKTRLTTGVELLRKNLPDIEKEIRERIYAGQQDELEKAGIITVDEDGKNWTLNEDKYYELSKVGTMATSDINKKTGISKINPKSMLEKIKNIGIFNWKYKKGEGPTGHTFQGPMAQDVKRELGEEVAPGGKEIDLVSMNGANMSAIQGLSEQIEELKGQTTSEGKEDTNYLKQISANTLRLVRLNEVAFKGMLKGRKGGDQQVQYTNQGFTGPSSGVKGVDDVTSFLQSGIALLSKGITSGVKGVWEGGTKGATMVRDVVDSNKDNIKAGGKYVADALANLVGKGLNFGGDVLFKHLPNGVAQAKNFMNLMSRKLKELVNGAQDLYKEGMASPVIQAQLMKAGYYRDQATGKVITTLDDLKNIKGHVVNHLGEVIITAEDVARGLYNSKGEKIRSTAATLGKALMGATIMVGQKLWEKSKEAITKGREVLGNLPGLDKLKGSARDTAEALKGKFSNMGFGFGDKRTFDVLVQIRDLVAIGKPKKIVEPILARPLGKADKLDPEKASRGFFNFLKKTDIDETKGLATDTSVINSESGETSKGEPTTPVTDSKGSGDLIARGLNKAKEFAEKVSGKFETDPSKQTIVDKLAEATRGRILKTKDKLKNMVAKPEIGELVGPKIPEMQGPFIPTSIKATRDLKDRFTDLKSKAIGLVKVEDKPEVEGPQIPTTVKVSRDLKDKASDIKEIVKDKYETAKGAAKSKLEDLDGKYGIKDKALPATEAIIEKTVSKIEKVVSKVLEAKDKAVEKLKPEIQGLPLPPVEGPQRPSLLQRAGDYVKDKATVIKEKVIEKVAPQETSPTNLPSFDVSAPKGKLGLLAKGLQVGKSLISGAVSKIGGIAGALMPSAETPQQNTGPESIAGRFNNMLISGKNQVRGMLKRKGSMFNDGDGDGSRDGNAAEQLKKQEEEKQLRLERNKASAEEAAERANVGIKYKSSENVIDTIAKKAGALFDMMKGGVGGLLETAASFLSIDKLKGLAGGLWKAIKNPMGIVKGVGKGITALRTVGMGVKAAAGLAAGTKLGAAAAATAKVAGMAKTALTVGGLAMGGVGGTVMSAGALALSGITAALSSPVVLGALAVAGVGAAGYYAYKRFTKDRLDPWETLRAMQYGLPGTDDSKKYNHMVMNLEKYLLDGKVGYSDGVAHLLDKKIDPKEIASIFSVDPGDSDKVDKLKAWLQNRFKPFFLNSVTALFSVDPKLGLDELSKLSNEKKKELLPLLENLEGPYHVTDHPFEDLEDPLTDIRLIKAQSEIIAKELGKEKVKGNKPNTQVDKTASSMEKSKKEEEDKKTAEEAKTANENKKAKESPGFLSKAWNSVFGDNKDKPADKPAAVPEGQQNGQASPSQGGSGSPTLAKSQAGSEAVGAASSTVGDPNANANTVSTGGKPVKLSEGIEGIKKIIAEAGRKVGVDPRIMQIMAAIESSFNPNAKAKTSSATGLFQFIKSTWQQQMKRHASKHGISPETSPTDPVANSLMGGEFLKENARIISSVKPNPSVTDLYIAHFLGPGGARQFLKAPKNAIGAQLFPSAASANKSIYYANGQPLTIGQIYQNFENKLKNLASRFGIEFPTTGTNANTEKAPTPQAEGPKTPPPLEKVGTTTPDGKQATSSSNVPPLGGTQPSKDTASAKDAAGTTGSSQSTQGSTSTASAPSSSKTTGSTSATETVAGKDSSTDSKPVKTSDGSPSNLEVRDFQNNSGLYKKPEMNRDQATPVATPTSDIKPKSDTIPGISKPQPALIAQPAQEPVKEEPKKKYPWVIDNRPDDIAVGRGVASSKSGEANFGAMDGVTSTMNQQLTLSREVRDVLKDRVAPTLEKMLEVLTNKVLTPSESKGGESTPSPKSSPTPTRPATPSFLDLRRTA